MAYYDEEPVASSEKVSDYNSAGLINKRMHELWVDANKHKRSAEFSSWNGDLDAVWCELVGDVTEDSKEDKQFKELNHQIKLVNPLRNWNINNMNQLGADMLNKKAKQYIALMNKEAFLRRLQNKQGKGTKYALDDDDWE